MSSPSGSSGTTGRGALPSPMGARRYYSGGQYCTTARNGSITRRSQSTTILGRCCDTTRIGTEGTLLEPDRIGENAGAYGGRSTVTGRDTRDGDRVSREPAGGDVTVVVRG